MAIGLTLARWMPEKGQYQIGPRQMVLHGCFVYVRKFVYLRKGRSGGCFIQHCVADFIVSPYCICKVHCLKRAV